MTTGRPGRVSGTYERAVSGFPYIVADQIVGRPEGGQVVAILPVVHGARDWPDWRWPSAYTGADKNG